MNNDAMTTNVTNKSMSKSMPEPISKTKPDTPLSEAELSGQMLADTDDLLDELMLDDNDSPFFDNTEGEDIDDDIENDSIDDDDAQDDDAPATSSGLDVIDETYIVTEAESGLRIDKIASLAFTNFSRAQLQGWISDGSLLYNGAVQVRAIKPVHWLMRCCITTRSSIICHEQVWCTVLIKTLQGYC